MSFYGEWKQTPGLSLFSSLLLHLSPHTQSFLVTFLTRCSAVAGQTKTHKRVDLIDAGSSVLARVGLAVVDVCRWREEEEERRGGESVSHMHVTEPTPQRPELSAETGGVSGRSCN